jgi:4-hydroxybenzoate polyprenyltransferase
MVVWLLAALTVLARGRSGPVPAGRAVRWGVRGFIVLLAAGTLMNAASSSPWERFLWAPLALVLLLLCLRLDRQHGADGSPDSPAA